MTRTALWDNPANLGAVLEIVGQIRELPAERVQLALMHYSRERLVELLATTAGLVDLDKTVGQLLSWRDWPTCSRGHPQSPENVRVEPATKSRRCRVCDRERKRTRYTKVLKP